MRRGCRVRNTWGAVFPADLLRDLDMRLELLRAGGGGGGAQAYADPRAMQYAASLRPRLSDSLV
jgi:hypothetical protein